MKLLFICILWFYHCQSFLNQWKPRFTVGKLHSDIRILIHGTKNAYTTLRPFDVVLYKMDSEIDGQPYRLGVFSRDKNILPLCSYGDDILAVDEFESPKSAESLNKQGRLLRVVSSDRRGETQFVIEEYINDDVYIPIKVHGVPKPVLKDLATNDNLENQLDKEIQLTLLKLTDLIRTREETRKPLKQVVFTPLAPNAVGPYSQAIKAKDFVFISGCIGLDPKTNKLAGDSIQIQTRQSMENLRAILIASGSSLENVCKTTIMVTDINSYHIVNEIYAEFFPRDRNPPARSTFAVAALPASALVEIEATAVLPNS